jgi:diguanylate cyclase (GGDEF)-like protein
MAPDNQAGPKPGILIVDDSRLIRVAAKKILSNDFTVTEAEDGEVAWSILLQNTSLQVVMSDLSMPNLDGLGLLDRIRSCENSNLKDIPVIIATGAEDDDGSKEEALSAGANNFITKPFNSTQLLATFKLLLKQQQTTQALKETESANIELQSQVSIDIITGVYNQKAFEQRGEEQLAYSIRHHTELALLGIQLDKYKIHFLRHGKAFAEALLKQFAYFLSQGRRREDTLAHLGHGEFALLLPSSDPIGTRHLANALRRRIEQHQFTVSGEPLTVTASLGIACPVLSHSTRFARLLEDTRQQLKAAELDGGNRVRATTVTDSHTEPTSSEPAISLNHIAQPGEVSQALNALHFKTPIRGDIDAIVRAVLPLLDNWNTHHDARHTEQLENIRNALFKKNPASVNTEATPGEEKPPTQPA